MERLAYLKIEENFTPHDASDLLEEAKKCGCSKVIVLHEDKADLRRAKYREKLLSVFRAAYRHKVEIYLADDSFKYSGTAFGELSSVKELQQKQLIKVKKEQAGESRVLAEKGEECIIVSEIGADEAFPSGHYADLTNGLSAEMVIESVYEPLCREYEKFLGYEFKGFAAICPVYNREGAVVYSAAANEKIQDIDYFKIMEKGEEYEKYMAVLRNLMEENYILPIKNFCSEKNLEFIICGGENSASAEFVNKNSKYSLMNEPCGGYLMEANSARKVISGAINRSGAVVPISLVMKKMEDIASFLLTLDSKKTDVGSLSSIGEECLITNMTENERHVCLLLEDYVIVNGENGELYPAEKTEYTFYPWSYLFIKKKDDNMYLEKLPCRVGGVLTGEYESDGEIPFERNGDVAAFYLPDESLFGKHIEFKGDFEFLKVRIGSMEESLIQKPFVMPLYDFLSQARGAAQALGGKIEKIEIKRRTS